MFSFLSFIFFAATPAILFSTLAAASSNHDVGSRRSVRRLESKPAYGKEYTSYVTPMYKGTYRLIASYADSQSLSMVGIFYAVFFEEREWEVSNKICLTNYNTAT